MIYDRSYMRQDRGAPQVQARSMVTKLLTFTIGIYCLQQSIDVFFPSLRGYNYFFIEWFALSYPQIESLKLWTLFSYACLHSTTSLLHIASNMLGLFFIGRIIEPIIGARQLLVLYFLGALLGGILFLPLHIDQNTVVVGASSSVMALLSFFCLVYPEERVTLLLFFIIPINVQPKWILRTLLAYTMFGVVYYEALGYESSFFAIAHSAHLGGILAGFFYHRWMQRTSRQSAQPNTNLATSIEPPAWFQSKKSATVSQNYVVNRRASLANEVDRILDKINTSGFGSLSSAEKATLEEAKETLKK
jgi:membrane associated rhomboid family serine protease